MTVKINLREFANLPESDVLRWRGYRALAEVTDDYGVTELSDTYTLMQTWQGLIVHREFPEAKYSVKQLVPSNKAGGNREIVYDDDTFAIPVNYSLQEIMPNIHDPAVNDFIKRLVYIWQTKLNNLLVVMGERSVISARAEDVDDCALDPGVIEIRQKILRGEISVDEGEILFTDHIKTADSLNFNTLALMARTGGVSINQAYQKVVMRGAVFDLDNSILPNVIKSNYAEGIANLADSLGDSKGSGMSLISNGRGLKDSETFHRKTHIFSAVISSINHEYDCGSTWGMPVLIASKEMAASYLGKFRIVEDGKLELIDYNTVKKIHAGETITVRTQAFCNNKKTGQPCGVCYGMLKGHLPYNTIMKKDANPGMFSSTTLCNPLGQKMLSTKHFIRNAIAKAFHVLRRDADIITTNGDDIYLNEEYVRENTRVILRSSIVRDLSDLRSLDVLDDISLNKLPYFPEVTFQYDVEDPMVGGKTLQQHPVHTSVSSRHARFSMGFLQYILENGWTVEDKKFISIDLSKWEHKEPLFTLPHTREDLNVHRAKVENYITFNKRNTAWKKQVVTPKIFGEVLNEFWVLVNAETKGINIVHLETILASVLTKDPLNGSYKLSNGLEDKYFSSFSSCIDNRGFGSVMIYEQQQTVLSNPKTFMIKDRQPSPLETYFQLATQ